MTSAVRVLISVNGDVVGPCGQSNKRVTFHFPVVGQLEWRHRFLRFENMTSDVIGSCA